MQILNKTLATAALAGLMVWSAAAQNLVTNGAFETPTGNNSFGPGSAGLTGWSVDTSPPDGVYLGVAASLVVNYSQSLELTGNTSTNRTTGGGISQTVATTQGAMYFISIDVASRTGTATVGNFNFGGTNLALATSSQTFTNLTWVVTASSSSTLIDITGDPSSSSQQLIIDNVYVSLATAPPGIASQPRSITNYAGNTTRFIVAAGGPPPLSYQWYFNTNTPLATGTSDTLTLTNVQSGGAYNVIVTNASGSVTSSVAKLTVLPNLVVNGDFENPFTPYYASITPGSTGLIAWTVDAAPPDGVQLGRPGLFASNNGSQTLQLTGGANYSTGGRVSQTIATTPDAYYTVSIDIACRETTLTVSGNFNFGGTSHALSVRGTTFTNVTWQAVATDNSTLINITGDPNSGSQQLIVDNVRVFLTVPGPVSAATSTVSASPASVGADGSTSTVTVRLTDTNGVPASGKTVTLAKTSGPGTPIITTVSGTTSVSGYATFTVSSTTPSTNAFAATDVTDGNLVITQTATVNFLPSSVANVGTSTVVAVPTSVLADGSAKSTITVTLKDVHNSPVSGKTVTLAKTSGPGAPVIAMVSGTSDVNGHATFTVASTTAGPDVFAATDVTDGNVAITQTASVTFTVGAVNAGTSTVVASPDVVPADGSDAATITVTLKDATGNGVPGKNVSLAITTVSGTTDTNGAAVFSVTSTTPGVDVFTATDVDDGNLIVAQTASVTFSSLINWSGFATTVAGDSDVATDGILLYAEHWAGVDATVNGVPFTAAQNHVVGSSGGYEPLTAATGYPQGSLSTAYWNILRGKWYNAGSGQTVTLNSLQPGHKYLVQIWSSDPRYSPSQYEIISPGFSLGIQAGQYGIGTFTAAGPTEVLGLGGDGVLNAVQTRDLSSIALAIGPGPAQLTINGYTDLAGNVVTSKATSLTAPIVWTPIQTNAVPGRNFSFTIPRGTGAAAFFRTMFTQ